MNQLLFERSTGDIGPNIFAKLELYRLIRSFRPAPRSRFNGGEQSPGASIGDGKSSIWAHQAGVSALALERFDGRVLISGGSDASIKIWDLEQCANPTQGHVYRPVAGIGKAEQADASAFASPRTPGAHRFGITHLSFFPFDSAAFLSTSYDQTLKLWATETARLSGSFALGAKVYTHAVSPIAAHLLVACGTQFPAVRLVDLRSGASVQSLVAPGALGGSAGAVLAVAWSPRHEHVLASGSVDGAVRIWDVRRASGLVGLLDKEDSLGILSAGRLPPLAAEPGQQQQTAAAGAGVDALRARGIRARAKAHDGPANGLAWTDDGAYLVSAGHDRRIRVWDAATGANTLASFGPTIRNGQLATAPMLLSPTGLTPPKRELLFWPNESEILVCDLHEGTILTRLREVGSATTDGGGPSGNNNSSRGGETGRSVRNRVTSIVWRGAGGGGGSTGVVMGGSNAAGGIYSGHLDGRVQAWLPALEGLDGEDEAGNRAEDDDGEAARKKRKVLDDAMRSLMGRQITFT